MEKHRQIYSVVNQEYMDQFKAPEGLKSAIYLVCAICDRKIQNSKGVTFPSHGLSLCSNCLMEILSKVKQ